MREVVSQGPVGLGLPTDVDKDVITTGMSLKERNWGISFVSLVDWGLSGDSSCERTPGSFPFLVYSLCRSLNVYLFWDLGTVGVTPPY